jgi:NADH:ubiquinone oxidoreductase subunit F (NADH-binding)/(2Fe-2S) ferredoxin/Pyruvate/2-oxoacid:ferredoxin oxidoreductase delta subunit
MSTVKAARIKDAEHLQQLREYYVNKRALVKKRVIVCAGTGCVINGSLKVFEQFQKLLGQSGVDVVFSERHETGVICSGCHGFCQQGPLVIIEPAGIFYIHVRPDDVQQIIEETLQRGELVERLLYTSPEGDRYATQDEIPFYKQQTRLVLQNAGRIDPEDITDYLASGGYLSLAKVLQMTPAAVVQQVTAAKLRGRGGAGFPTGIKWEEALHRQSEVKYVVCNADEGDPGAFMDRSLLESDPHAVIEGMIIAGYATGATEGLVYVRAEYPLAMKRLQKAIVQALEQGLLGQDILGSGYSFSISIFMGGGVFICGESTALIASLEAKVGEPRQKPPHLVESGYLGKPTILNNVETLANVPLIFKLGAEKYAALGSGKSGGTKIFCLTGKVNNTGLVEVPIGIPLEDIIFGIGGGIQGGRAFKAVQTGGPSGGCLDAGQLHMPTDFEELKEAGSMMGSGGMIVLDEKTCAVDLAKYFLRFLKDESCGKCFSCREGIVRMLDVVDDITTGQGNSQSMELLLDLAEVVADASMCGLGQSAANPVLSTIRYFAHEYKAHIEEKKCFAGVCKDLLSYLILAEYCKGCGVCAKGCPVSAISGEKGQLHVIDTSVCQKCGICLESCKFSAVLVS